MTVSCQISLCLPSAFWVCAGEIIQYYSCFLNDRERIENFAFFRIFGFALGQLISKGNPVHLFPLKNELHKDARSPTTA